MAKVHIQELDPLFKQIINNEFEFGTMLAELNQHLDRGRRFNHIEYEVEVLNMIATLYSHQNQMPQVLQYLGEALEKSYQTDNSNLILKLDNNMGIEYLNIWDIDAVEEVTSRCIKYVEDQELKDIAAGYIYFLMIQIKILRFRYDEAQFYLDQVQDIIKHIDLLKHRYINYQQLSMISKRHQILIDIATGQCEKASNHIKLLGELSQHEGLPPFITIIKIHVNVIYALVCMGDEEHALDLDKQIPSDLPQSIRPLYPSMSMDAATFLAKHNQIKWAKCFANHAINAIPEGQTEVFHKLIRAAQAILDLE